jgi:Reverse transcriptase (RNA-dependent DNA polymerase)
MHKGYYCLYLPSHRLYISRHVTFNETEFPFSTVSHPNTPADTSTLTSLLVLPAATNPLTLPTVSNFSSLASVHTDSLSVPTPTTAVLSPSLVSFSPSSSHSMVTKTQTRSLKPRKFPDYHLCTVSTSDNYLEPTCFTQASKDPTWRQAMANELTALAQNATWDLVAPPPDAHVIGAKWIFKLKLRVDDTIKRHKARLVAKGFSQ